MAQALAQLGMNSADQPRNTQSAQPASKLEAVQSSPAWPQADNDKDYYVSKNGVKYAGTHLLIDLWGASKLDDIELVEEALRRSAIEAGATILHCHLHHFQPNGGISGVLVLAESHISIHSWPERGYAALDVFVCGDCDPYKAVPILKEAFTPDFVTLSESKRGLMP